MYPKERYPSPFGESLELCPKKERISLPSFRTRGKTNQLSVIFLAGNKFSNLPPTNCRMNQREYAK